MLKWIPPKDIEASEDAPTIYRLLHDQAVELDKDLELLEKIAYYKKFLKIADEILGECHLSQKEIDCLFGLMGRSFSLFLSSNFRFL